ncbi:GTP cyclohydrolase FolE2 [Comamonadaceae bacterium G21597-S1]|nr:GTP cyclohydrolase FolE2 [Comamonadaceae bacterium G21597-S1]
MNARPPLEHLADTQSSHDHRSVAIDAVGVKGVRYPIRVRSGAHEQSTIAVFDMTVALAADIKGTHMSRFIELLESMQGEVLDLAGLSALATDMVRRLQASQGCVTLRFPYFVRKSAPVSGAQSLLDCDVLWQARVDGLPGSVLQMAVSTPVTSLCPCSKAISREGAHNQRSITRIQAQLNQPMTVEDLVAIAESSASCAVYGLLKRADEKYVTERAYDNPRFVEDMVREATLSLGGDPRVAAFDIEIENLESIHNHSAYARVTRPALQLR